MKNWRNFIWLFFFSTKMFGEPFSVPPLTSPVMDLANVIEPKSARQLEQVLRQAYQSGGPQLAILTVPSLGDDVIENVGIKVVDQWKLGQKGKDDGLLVLVAPNDRKVRIEVGRGLEGIVTDAMSRRIIREIMTPSFKAGNYSKGILEGVYAIVSMTSPDLDLNGLGVKPSKFRKSSDENIGLARGILIVFFVGLLIVWSIFAKVLRTFGLLPHSTYSNSRGGWHGGGGWGGGGSSGGGGWSGGGGGFGGGGSSGSW